MSVTRRLDRCPQCQSMDIRELGRLEAGDAAGLVTEDLILYRCDECGNEFDSAETGPVTDVG